MLHHMTLPQHCLTFHKLTQLINENQYSFVIIIIIIIIIIIVY